MKRKIKTYHSGAQAFTLIELLVVVLIIGILSAIALPQYQRAVRKARATEAITNLQAIARAQEIYKLANDRYTTDLTELDIEIKNGFYRYTCPSVGSDCYATPIDGSVPFFEQSDGLLFCRGAAENCKPFSTVQWGNNPSETAYWIINF